MGLMGAGGQIALREGIRQRLMDEAAARQREFQNSIELRRVAVDEQDSTNRRDEHSAMMREKAAAANETEAQKAAGTYSIDQSLPAPVAKMLQGTMQAPNVQTNPPLAQPPGVDMMQPDIVPGMQPGAVWKGTDAQRATRSKNQYLGQLIDSLPPDSRERRALEYNRGTGGDNPPAGMWDPKPGATGNGNYMLKGKPIVGLHTNGRISYQGQDVTDQVTPYVAPPTTAPGSKLVKVEHKDPTTGRTVIEWLPEDQLRGKTFQKGVGSATETRLASAQAVNQTGDDIIAQVSDPATAQKLGAVMGRYSKLQDFIGNPPPEYSELAGSIESYALANMGVHGMRSAQGALQIKQLLDQPHTPQSLIAAVRGLNKFSQHFMENEGRDPASPAAGPKKAGAPGGKPTAEDLINKYRARP